MAININTKELKNLLESTPATHNIMLSGKHGIGLGTQSVLWSDAAVFAANAEAGGTAIMFAMTQHALNLAKGMSFITPLAVRASRPQLSRNGMSLYGTPEAISA